MSFARIALDNRNKFVVRVLDLMYLSLVFSPHYFCWIYFIIFFCWIYFRYDISWLRTICFTFCYVRDDVLAKATLLFRNIFFLSNKEVASFVQSSILQSPPQLLFLRPYFGQRWRYHCCEQYTKQLILCLFGSTLLLQLYTLIYHGLQRKVDDFKSSVLYFTKRKGDFGWYMHSFWNRSFVMPISAVVSP